jgi:hypothetical protein
MDEILKRLGLILDFDFRYPIEKEKAIELLTSSDLDKKTSSYYSLFGSNIPTLSSDFKYDKTSGRFEIIRPSSGNLAKGRGIIVGKIETNNKNITVLKGRIISKYRDLRFVLIMLLIFMTIIVTIVLQNDKYGFEWILVSLGFFIFVTIEILVLQRFEVKKIKKSVTNYFDRLKKN